MGGMVAIFAPGLTIAKQGSLFFTVARVIFPYVLLISASSLYVGILNSAKKFGPGAFCPVITKIMNSSYNTQSFVLAFVYYIYLFNKSLFFCCIAGHDQHQ